MDPNKFAQQTSDIICCFFDGSYLDVDSPSEGNYDPEKIGAQLRDLGDHYDETVIQPLMRDVQKAATDQAAAMFSKSVNILCNMWVSERPEVAPEKHLLKATMALSLYVMRNCPDLTMHVRGTVFNILTSRLGDWVMHLGGWEQVLSQ